METFNILKVLNEKNINYKKDRYNFIDCYINNNVFTIDNLNQESRIKSLLETIIDLSKENEELKKDSKILCDLNKEQNEVFSNFAKIIKEKFEIDNIDISVTIKQD